MGFHTKLLQTQTLQPHPLNNQYFNDLAGEDFQRLTDDILRNGFRDPLKVTTAGLIIAGHQRWRVAVENHIEEVPCDVLDVSEEQVEEILLLDNLNRRHLDAIQKAKIIGILQEKWDLKRGGNEEGRTMKDVAAALGTTPRTAERLAKLNDLIPELQTLVAEKKLKTTVAETLAHLPEEEQQALYTVLGEQITQKNVSETKDLRKAIEASRTENEAISDDSSIEARIQSVLQEKEAEWQRKLEEAQALAQSAQSYANQLESQLEGSNEDEEKQRLQQELEILQQQIYEMEEQAYEADNQIQKAYELEREIEEIKQKQGQQEEELQKQVLMEKTRVLVDEKIRFIKLAFDQAKEIKKIDPIHDKTIKELESFAHRFNQLIEEMKEAAAGKEE